MNCSRSGCPSIVENLLNKQDININIQDNYGWTTGTLMFACLHNKKEIVKMLLNQKQIDVNLTNLRNESARDIAFDRSYYEIPMLIDTCVEKNSTSNNNGNI